MSNYEMNKELKTSFSESEVLKEIQERNVKNFLDVIVLIQLRKTREPMGGYDLVKLIHNKFGVLVSAGSAYALLYSMERDGLIRSGLGRKRVYKLAVKGDEKLEAIMQVKEKLLGLMVNIFI